MASTPILFAGADLPFRLAPFPTRRGLLLHATEHLGCLGPRVVLIPQQAWLANPDPTRLFDQPYEAAFRQARTQLRGAAGFSTRHTNAADRHGWWSPGIHLAPWRCGVHRNGIQLVLLDHAGQWLAEACCPTRTEAIGRCALDALQDAYATEPSLLDELQRPIRERISPFLASGQLSHAMHRAQAARIVITQEISAPNVADDEDAEERLVDAYLAQERIPNDLT